MSVEKYDVAVVGAGFGGIYAAHRFRQDGLSVVGIEGASGFGGVWYHNGYPGARVDSDSIYYCFTFAKQLYERWQWTERYADQAELMRYLNWAADELDVRPLFKFDTWVRSAKWSPSQQHWVLTTEHGESLAARYVVMCTGNLSEPKPITFPGLSSFKGDWYQASRWPLEEVSFEGKRVAIVGTGSSGVQAVPPVAENAEHLYVFQRTPHYAIPAQNYPEDGRSQAEFARSLAERRAEQLTRPTMPPRPPGLGDWPRPLNSYTPEERLVALEKQWDFGGHGMSYLFSDQATDWSTNDAVAGFVRDKVRQRVDDPVLAEKLLPDYPIGTRRLIMEIGYYEALNQSNVSLVDMREDPIVEISTKGIRTGGAHYEVDTIIFALGFRAFLGALDSAGVENERGVRPSEVWRRGPRTLFGLMTPGFPNLFHPTNAGSPSVLSNLVMLNEFHADWISECIAHMREHGYHSLVATEDGADAWQDKAAEQAENIIRRQVDNYMVHVNKDDGSRIFQPWYGGLGTYVPEVLAATANGYEGVKFE